MSEGSRGGSDNRPASRSEIQKFARTVCRTCRMAGPVPMVVDGQCSNAGACDRRRRKWERENPPPVRPPPPVATPHASGCRCTVCAAGVKAKRK